MILYGFIGGVEEGDVAFAINNGNVVSEKNPNKIADLIPSLLSMPNPKISERFKTNWAIKIAKRLMAL